MSNGYTARMPFGRRPVGRDLPTGALARATGFVSTAGDLARFFSQLDPRSDSKLLSVASRRAMTRAHRDIPGLPLGRQYGLGIIRGTLGAHRVVRPFRRLSGLPDANVRAAVARRRVQRADQRDRRTLPNNGPMARSTSSRRSAQPRRAERICAPVDRSLVEHLGRVRSGTGRQSGAGRAAESHHAVLRRDRADGARRRRSHLAGRRIRNVRRIGANRARQTRASHRVVAGRRTVRRARRRSAETARTIEWARLNRTGGRHTIAS